MERVLEGFEGADNVEPARLHGSCDHPDPGRLPLAVPVPGLPRPGPAAPNNNTAHNPTKMVPHAPSNKLNPVHHFPNDAHPEHRPHSPAAAALRAQHYGHFRVPDQYALPAPVEADLPHP